jgi:sugar O-acyltransferase (sialic acid O-acetyltransferase NeuD family)
MKNLVIIGAGGHGLVVADAAELMGEWQNVYFMDTKYPDPLRVNEIQVISQEEFAALNFEITDVAVAVGDNVKRLALIKEYINNGYNCPVIKHPSAIISRSASLGIGTVVLANAVINPKAILGIACIINTAAVIEHQCVLGDGVHVSPTACLAGNVSVGAYSWIAAGAVVINNIHIGHNVIVGAGSVVITDLSSDQCVVGVPAREKNKIEESS